MACLSSAHGRFRRCDFLHRDVPAGPRRDGVPARLDRRRLHLRDPRGHVSQGRARGDPRAHRGCDARHRPLPPAGPPPTAAQHPRRPRGIRQRPVRRARPPQERLDRSGRRAPDVPGHRDGDRQGEEGRIRVHGRRRRGADRPGHRRHVPDDEPPLQPDGAARHVHREEHRHEPPGRDQDPGHRRRRLQVLVHGEGRRLGEQELSSSRRRRRC